MPNFWRLGRGRFHETVVAPSDDVSPYVQSYRTDPYNRAETLLWAHLDATQRALYARRGQFEVTTSHRGGTVTWRLGSFHIPVVVDTTGTHLRGRLHVRPVVVGTKMCAHPRQSSREEFLPAADILLATKLLLESRGGPRRLIRRAHWWF